jgi:predicted AlkP superfamily phosphohydrolase/phosphomutase
MMKVIVFGMDGGDWQIIDKYIAELPNIARLKNEGVHGIYESSIPPVTYPAWKCYSTGKNPGKLGVFYHTSVDFENQKINVHTSRMFKSKELWDYLGEKGYKAGIINMPTTYPPKEVNGFMISSWEQLGNYTYPDELEATLLKKYNYKIDQDYRNMNLLRDERYKDNIMEQIKSVVQAQFDMACDMLPDVDFLHLSITHTDTIQHRLWDSPELKELWKLIDKNIGRFIKPDNTLFMMSDHGFAKIKKVLNLTTWLEKNGFLVKRKTSQESMKKMGITMTDLEVLARKIHVKKLIPKSVIKATEKVVPKKIQNIEMDVEKGTDWDETKAISQMDVIYVKNKDKEITDQIIEKLKMEEDVVNIYKPEDIYSGPHMDRAPDIIIEPEEGILLMASYNDSLDTFWFGTHRKQGIFAAWGDCIQAGSKIDTKIYDLAPTILHLMNCPVPKDMDGNILLEIFQEGSEPNTRPVDYFEEEKEKDMLDASIKKINISGI